MGWRNLEHYLRKPWFLNNTKHAPSFVASSSNASAPITYTIYAKRACEPTIHRTGVYLRPQMLMLTWPLITWNILQTVVNYPLCLLKKKIKRNKTKQNKTKKENERKVVSYVPWITIISHYTYESHLSHPPFPWGGVYTGVKNLRPAFKAYI